MIHAIRLFFLMVFLPIVAFGQIITTVVGNGTSSFSNGLPALSTGVGNTTKVVFDNSGNLYFSSLSLHRVLKVDSLGIVNCIAGNGTSGFSGDNGPATSAQYFWTRFVAIDSGRNIYIPDFINNRIRKVDAISGIIHTICGSTNVGFGGDSSLAINATINGPVAITFDKQWNLFFSDFNNNRVRKIDAVTGIITTIAGIGIAGYNGDNIPAITAQLYHPYGICFDTAGSLLIAEYDNNRLRKVSDSGIITTIAGNGTNGYNGDSIIATSAEVSFIYDVAVDINNNVYIADLGNNRVRMVNNVGLITTVAGNGNQGYGGDSFLAVNAQLNRPTAVTIDACNNLYIGDMNNNRIRKVWFNTDTLPHVNIAITPNDTVITGTQVTTTATATNHGTVTSYQWVKNGVTAGTSSTYTYTPVNGDSVYCIVTVRACTGRTYTDTTQVLHITVTGDAGITSTTNLTIQTYPNPVTDVLHVATTEPKHYVLHNLMGVTLLQGSVDKQNSIDMKAIPAGIYLLQLTNTQGQREVVRVVKE